MVTSTSAGNGKVQVFVPDATGAYPQTPTAAFPVGPNPVAITTGDFNGDGLLDVAVINKGDSSLSILFGTGTGTFAPNVFTVGILDGVPESVTAGRFSGSSGADDVAIGVVQNVSGATRVGIVIVPGSSTTQFSPSPSYRSASSTALGRRSPPPTCRDRRSALPGASWRDLAIAFTDRTPSGDAVGRIKVLLGRDGGGFGDVNAAQTLDLGATLPSSIKVADLDDDGVVDLIVSAYGQSDEPDRRRDSLLPGPSCAGPQRRLPAQSPLVHGSCDDRNSSTRAGRRPFRKSRPGQPIANMGIASINAPDLDSIAVFQGNGQGCVRPALIDHDADGRGRSSLRIRRLPFPRWHQSAAGLGVYHQGGRRECAAHTPANGAGGFAAPDPGQPPLLAGNSPSHMVAGQFVPNGPTSAWRSSTTPARTQQQPVLKMFFGQGNGVLTPAEEVTDRRRRPAARHRGRAFPWPQHAARHRRRGRHFAGGSTTASGKLTLLFKDGHGVFTVVDNPGARFCPRLAGDVQPAARGRQG